MKILAVECSATSVSCAVSVDNKIVAHSFSNLKITHSQTLMPMVNSVLQDAKISVKEIDAFAVSAGPGSFTGIRIGISAIKGMAAPRKADCFGVSTLEAIAYNYADTDCIVASVMDARCFQVYNALFRIKDGIVTRICEDRALMIDELLLDLEKYKDEKVIFAGDGSHLFEEYENDNLIIADEERRYQNACGVINTTKNYRAIPYDKLLPIYLRLPQAERELKAKTERK